MVYLGHRKIFDINVPSFSLNFDIHVPILSQILYLGYHTHMYSSVPQMACNYAIKYTNCQLRILISSQLVCPK